MPKATPFPLKDYFASLAFLSLLLSACVVVLPQSTSWFYPHALESQLAQRSSADRPEHPWLTPFTASAAGTAAWCAFGVAVTMLWWGGKVGAWWGVPALNGKRATEAAAATAGTTLFFALCLHVLGAPAHSWLRNLLFALNLALLTAWPVVAALGLPSIHDDGIAARYRLTRILCSWRAEDSKERALAFPVAGTLIGAWVGAVPIPLDWDRPWQTYPLTPLVGALVGFLAGGYLSFYVSAYESLRNDVMAEQANEAAKAKPVVKRKKGGKAK